MTPTSPSPAAPIPTSTSSTGAPSSSPLRSPRLPSPPPFTEVQFTPSSPSGTSVFPASDLPSSTSPEATTANASNRRILPGSKSTDIHSGPPLIPLNEVPSPFSNRRSHQLITPQLDSPFQLQEHLLSLHHHHTHPASADTTVPLDATTIPLLTTPPPSIDPPLWLYELTRLLTTNLNALLLPLFPVCTAQTCPEMRASEWQYLCAVHDPPKACSAIDYSCHTLDWAANVLTSARVFPSRLSLGGAGEGGQGGGMRQLQSVIRRLGRIYAHAWWSHRSVFWETENAGGGYGLFRGVCEGWGLGEEGGVMVGVDGEEKEKEEKEEVQILKKAGAGAAGNGSPKEGEETPGLLGVGRDNKTARRHKSSASTGTAVFAVMEEDEGEKGDASEEKSDRSVLSGTSPTTDPPANDAKAQDPRPASPLKSIPDAPLHPPAEAIKQAVLKAASPTATSGSSPDSKSKSDETAPADKPSALKKDPDATKKDPDALPPPPRRPSPGNTSKEGTPSKIPIKKRSAEGASPDDTKGSKAEGTKDDKQAKTKSETVKVAEGVEVSTAKSEKVENDAKRDESPEKEEAGTDEGGSK